MLVKIPGVGHGAIASRPSQAAAKASAILAWFDRYRVRTTASSAPLSEGTSAQAAH